mmetsp:Transcript_32041/g.69147  ORF Transcript_32041/g.69147 Transcript_32041/m.69147 type:complete len:172 (-) Transcript_32041:51-566(-)
MICFGMVLVLLEVVSSFRADFTDASQSSANTSALTRGKTCSEECAKKPADEQQQMHCCAEGLVCDRTTKTCELEIGSTCHGGFRKFVGLKKKWCGRTHGGPNVACGEDGRCCVPSFPAEEGWPSGSDEEKYSPPFQDASKCCSGRKFKWTINSWSIIFCAEKGYSYNGRSR